MALQHLTMQTVGAESSQVRSGAIQRGVHDWDDTQSFLVYFGEFRDKSRRGIRLSGSLLKWIPSWTYYFR
jgi:hypothetical protein